MCLCSVAFLCYFLKTVLYNLDCSDVLSADELISLFNSTFTSTLDSVAPVRTKQFSKVGKIFTDSDFPDQ